MTEIVGQIAYEVTLDTSKMIGESRVVNRELDGLRTKFTQVSTAVGLLGAAMAAVKSAQLADDLRLLGARVQVAAGSMEAGAKAMSDLEAISKRTQTSVAANAEVFARLNSSIKAMGGTQADTLRMTETLGMAIKVSGASAEEAKSAMLQFGQAMGSGKLQGDELRSLMENAPYLMRQLADAIGVPVGSLKQLGEQGKLTSDVIATALGKASGQIQQDFAQFPQTLAGAITVMEDAAKRANEKFDELTGTSTALTGITKGLALALDDLAKQFGAANQNAGELSKNDKIKSWADSTRTVLSYVVDTADFVTRGFKQMGTGLAGLAASAGQAAQGNLQASADILKQMAADVQAIGSAPYAGAKMRELAEAGAGGGRGFINSEPTASKLTPPTTSGDSKKAKVIKFDEAKYIAELRKQQDSEMQVINDTEDEKLRVAKKNLDERKISERSYYEAVTLIVQTAEDDRLALRQKAQDQIDKGREQDAAKTKAAFEEKKRGEREAANYAFQLAKAVDPIAALKGEYEAKLALVVQYEQAMALAGIDATTQAQMARTQITGEYEKQRMALAEQTFRSQGAAQEFLIDSVNALSNTASTSIMGLIDGTMTAQDVMRGLGKTIMNEAVSSLVQLGLQQVKNAVLGDAIAASKGVAYAASVSAQVAGMSALAAQNAFAATAAIPIVGPGLAPAAAAAAAATAGALGAPAIATAPVAGARQYGGAVSAGSLYRVNEKGAPEMFTASNGTQYLMPLAGGAVTAADKISPGGGWTIVVNNNASGSTASASVNDQSRTITIAVNEVASQIRNNTGPVWSAMRGATNVQGRL